MARRWPQWVPWPQWPPDDMASSGSSVIGKPAPRGKAETERSPNPTGVRSSERFTADLLEFGEVPTQPAGPQSPPPASPCCLTALTGLFPQPLSGRPAPRLRAEARIYKAIPQPGRLTGRGGRQPLRQTQVAPGLALPGLHCPGENQPSATLRTHLQQDLGLLQHSCSLPFAGAAAPQNPPEARNTCAPEWDCTRGL